MDIRIVRLVLNSQAVSIRADSIDFAKQVYITDIRFKREVKPTPQGSSSRINGLFFGAPRSVALTDWRARINRVKVRHVAGITNSKHRM